MTPNQLRRRIKWLDPNTPQHLQLSAALNEGAGFNNAWYRSQKEHWLGWLAEYAGPGAYGRTYDPSRDAKFVYNHIQCAPMLFWLAEAIDVPAAVLESAERAILNAPSRNASQCAAFRKIVPWQDIESAVRCKPGNWSHYFTI